MTTASRWPAALALLVALMVAAPALAAFQLVLKDGRTLSGVDMERVNGNYVLIQSSGERLTLAADQVTEVRIIGDDVLLKENAAGNQSGAEEGDPSEAEEEDEPVGTNLAGGDVSDRIVRGEPSVLAGGEVMDMNNPPAEALAGDRDRPLQPGEWRPEGDWGQNDDGWLKDGWVTETPDRTWTPDSDYATDLEDNNWNPSTWTKPAIDPTWTPTDAYGRGTSADSTWTPTDGFKRTNSSMRVDLPVADAGAATTDATGSGTPPPDADMDAAVSGGRFEAMVGFASWYGEAFRGRATASGKLFDPDRLTAAHATLPFGTLVMVRTQGEPARSVMVEINDRGAGDRVINLSESAAAALGMLKSGVIEVRIEPIPDEAAPVAPVAVADTGDAGAAAAGSEQVPAVPAGDDESTAAAGAPASDGKDEERR